eukprot:4618913-Pyramimonas_sp.AAC.1
MTPAETGASCPSSAAYCAPVVSGCHRRATPPPPPLGTVQSRQKPPRNTKTGHPSHRRSPRRRLVSGVRGPARPHSLAPHWGWPLTRRAAPPDRSSSALVVGASAFAPSRVVAAAVVARAPRGPLPAAHRLAVLRLEPVGAVLHAV